MSLSQEQLDKLVSLACNYLYQDRINPDVGMGMFIETALEYAQKDLLEEARIWGTNKHIVISTQEKLAAYTKIETWKRKNNI